MSHSRKQLTNRLAPLYVAIFLQGFVLWYAIEKVFMASIGFDGALFGVLAATYAMMSLLLETPSGILADRWSRRGILMVAGLLLALSSLVCGLTSSVVVYIFGGAVLWGAFNALYSGTSESIIYDVLEEELGDAKLFSRYYGRMQVVIASALVVGALLGAVVADVFGLRVTFLLTVPIALSSIIVLAFFREPQLHKQGVSSPLKDHAWLTIRSVTHQRKLLPVLLVLIIGSLVTQLILEFSQLWFLAIGISVVWYGVAGAVLYSTFGFGGVVAEHFTGISKHSMRIIVGILLLASLGLVFANYGGLIIGMQCLVLVIITAVKVVFTKYLHDELPSKVRAGSASAVSTLSGLAFIPTALLFGAITGRYSVFAAAVIILFLVCIVIAAVMWHTATTKNAAAKAA